jgi:hypothetical protein
LFFFCLEFFCVEFSAAPCGAAKIAGVLRPTPARRPPQIVASLQCKAFFGFPGFAADALRDVKGQCTLVLTDNVANAKVQFARASAFGDGVGTTMNPPQVRKTPSWPRSWANCSLL